MSKLYVARVFAYETPSTEAKGKASVGMSVASKLNGNAHWVGTYVEGRANPDLKVGFITAPQKFSSLEAAEAHAEKMARLYPRGTTLNPKEWAWGELLEDNIHEVLYKDQDISSPEAASADRGSTAATLTT